MYTTVNWVSLKKSIDNMIQIIDKLGEVTNEHNRMKNVSLLPHQVAHVARLMDIFTTEKSAMDFSCMGLGKTYTSTECAIRLGLTNLFVVCPLAMESKWKEVAKMHGITNVVVTSFASLRSVSGCQPKHGYLKRVSVDSKDSKMQDGTPKKVEEFEVTEKFLDLAERRGVMMVIDEVHNLKNSSEQFKACKILTDIINNSESGKSRCILLSGTPIDKEEQTIKMLRLLGIYTRKEMSLLGVSEYVAKLSTKDRERVISVVKETPAKINAELVRLCHVLFREIVCNHWVSTMPNPREVIDCKNGYYKLEERDSRFLEFYIGQLHSSSGFTTMTGAANGEGIVVVESGKLGAISKSLEGIEQSKVPLFERLVRETLASNPRCKVVVGMNFVQRTLLSLADRLKDLSPGIIIGDTSRARRDELIKSFQEPNTKCRLLIANIKCLSTGVDLDDKVGDFPRYVFASPNYTIVDLHQFSRRFIRTNTIGIPVFRFVYGACARKEHSIINALARKTAVLQDILVEQTSAGIKFPGEYEDFEEV